MILQAFPMTAQLWDSKIELGAEFFNEVINRPVPLNMNALAASFSMSAPPWASISTSELVYRIASMLRAPLLALLRRRSTASSEWTRTTAGDNRTVQDFRKDSLLRVEEDSSMAWPDLLHLCDGQACE